jgi:hypothetical protein
VPLSLLPREGARDDGRRHHAGGDGDVTTSGTLQDWHDFYVVIGAAAGALIGSLFVVASLGLGYLNPSRTTGMRVFLTPIIAHVAGILVACAALVAPSTTILSLEEMAGIGALGGVIYAAVICRNAWGMEVGKDDRFWYGVVPVIAYAVALGAAAMLVAGRPAGLVILAAAVVLQLIAAIRNAWDMVLFLVSRDRASG